MLQIYKEYYGRKEILIQNNTMYGMYTMAISSGLKLKAGSEGGVVVVFFSSSRLVLGRV